MSTAMPSQGPNADVLDRLCAGADDPRSVPSVVVVAAHPDDETVGAGARLPRWRQALFVCVTDGAPRDPRHAAQMGFPTRQAYAQARGEEMRTALGLAGASYGQVRHLGFFDQEASLGLTQAAQAVARVLLESRPEVVVTHPYEGGHPDHDATAFAVHAARRLLERQGVRPPEAVEMTSYHNGPRGLTAGEFLAHDGCPVTTRVLSGPELAFKRRLCDCYPSQQDTLRWLLTDRECFRPAPAYDFTRPPHEGRLFYELFDWGMTGPRWRRLATDALNALQLRGAS